MRKWVAISLAFLAIDYSSALFADTADAPLQITVAVADRSDTALQGGLQSAFSQAMTDMSNDLQITTLPAIKNASSNVSQWVQSYSYLDSQSESAQPGLSLQVIFDRNGLEQLLREAKPHTASNSDDAASIVSLYISGVRNISDYSRITAALRDNKNVQQVSVKNMNAYSVLLEVKVVGNATDLQQELSTDNRFMLMAEQFRVHLAAADLYYDWTGNQA